MSRHGPAEGNDPGVLRAARDCVQPDAAIDRAEGLNRKVKYSSRSTPWTGRLICPGWTAVAAPGHKPAGLHSQRATATFMRKVPDDRDKSTIHYFVHIDAYLVGPTRPSAKERAARPPILPAIRRAAGHRT
jgi:hypothetical protein